MLKVGDKIRITKLPELECPLHEDTKEVYEILIARKRPVRISRISLGSPWFDCKIKRNGVVEHHSLIVGENDNNWVKVKHKA